MTATPVCDSTVVEIVKTMVGASVLCVRDRMSLDRSKSMVTLALAQWGKNQTLEGSLSLPIPAASMKLWALDIIERRFEVASFQIPFADPESGGTILRVVRISRDPKAQWGPYKLQMLQSLAEKTGNGYKPVEEQVNLVMSIAEEDARRFFLSVYDYIRDWETVNFRRRQEAQSIIVPIPGGG